ncbi:hypothetical protein V8C86DRAFT_1403625 [Haematococcus lacustris]
MHPGSPGYVAISIDPSLQASHFVPLTSLHPTPADISSSPSGTASGAAAAADGRGAEAGAVTQEGVSAGSGGELDLGCSSGQAAQAASRPPAAPHPDALGNPSLASVVHAMLARVAALSRVPLFTLMASFPASTSAQPLLPVAAAVAHHSYSSGLAWVSVDSSKPGRDSPQASSALAPTLVAVSTPAFAQQLLDLDPTLAHPPAPYPATPTTTTTPTQGHLTQSSLGDSSSNSSSLGQGPDGVGQAGSTSRGVGAALPAQTPDYLLAAAPACFVIAGDFCHRAPGSGAPGLEDAACSGQAAAEAVMCGAW